MIGHAVPVEQFEREAHDFLSARFDKRSPGDPYRWGKGSDVVSLFREETEAAEAQSLSDARRWLRERFDAGYGWIDGPVDRGGGGLTADHARAYARVEASYATPDISFFTLTTAMLAPLVQQYGTQEIVARYLTGMYRGDYLACQLFAEPGAGSDLASVRTRAEATERGWVVSGHKVWSSSAHVAELGILLCRMDQKERGRSGLSMLLIELRAQGVEIRPMRQMTGGSTFDEVIFRDAPVPRSHLLGEEGAGWLVLASCLMAERSALGNDHELGPGPWPIDRLVDLIAKTGRTEDAITRDLLARVYTGLRIGMLTLERARQEILESGSAGPGLAVTKLLGTRTLQEVSALVTEVLGSRLIADSGEWGEFSWSRFVSGVPSLRISGGSDNIQRNYIAESVLRLPRDQFEER
jgi:alkylation response protein AidB-like acyl-CoA dehydrogenase